MLSKTYGSLQILQQVCAVCSADLLLSLSNVDTHSSICCKWRKLHLLNAGYNNIDIEAAKARGVPVCTAPGYNAASVAEGALMMMLMLARRVHEQEVTPGLPLSASLNGPALVPSSIWVQATLL